ncbi:MAG: NAD(P)/FAD-dependent oxidoreductase [Janthinobacterium lividum]
MYSTDVVIVGAGPVGLFAIFECGMMRMKCHVIDTLDMVGGQCSALYPEKPIYDIPGHPKISGQDLIDNLQEQASPFDPVYHLKTQVISLEPLADNRWQVGLSNGAFIDTKVVIIAAGVGAFGPNRPPLENLESFEDKSVFYHVKKREDFRDKRVVIAGGGDSAVDWAISLSEVAEKVMVVHRRAKFRAAPEAEAKLHALASEGKLEMIIPYQLDRLEGDQGVLKTVVVKALNGQEKHLSTDYLLPFFGLSMNLGPIAYWGLNLDKNHIVINSTTCETNIAGIYAIGDIAHYPQKLKLILCGFSEAAQVARAARALVFPGEVWHFEYSTTQGVAKIA